MAAPAIAAAVRGAASQFIKQQAKQQAQQAAQRAMKEKAGEAANLAKGIMADRTFQIAMQAAIPSFGLSIFFWLHYHFFLEHIVKMKSKCMFGDTKLVELGIMLGVYVLFLLIVSLAIALLATLIKIFIDPWLQLRILGEMIWNKITGS